MQNNLINLDISRCSDWKCPTNAFCARYRQRAIDKEKGQVASCNDFQGRNKNGLCDYFINIE
jgi:hypothetical protein